jgi:DNA mismatch repair protein MutL
MSRIKQLSAQEAQKIAAGEVVERPANIVKELIENSIDAGATDITVYIKDGGKQLIRVIDNGHGMSIEDAHMCLKHHATSKITCVDDLFSIDTFGFRGEALSSISSVSKLTLITKTSETIAGITLEVMGDNSIKEYVTACNTGTDITIENLFYNVPARKKFLKTKETEWRAIVQLFQAFCLAYQHIQFKIFNDEKLVYNCPITNTFEQRLEHIYDSMLTRHILLFHAQDKKSSLSCSGALTDIGYTRYDRNHIFLFVNKRWVKNNKLIQAFIRGYQQVLPPQQYPAGFIFITIDQNLIDINIHPRKEEVLFLHPRITEALIESAVKQRLEEYMTQKLGNQIRPKNAPDLTNYRATTPHITFPEHNPFTMRHITSTDTMLSQTQNLVDTQIEKTEEKQLFTALLDTHFAKPAVSVEAQEQHALSQELQYTLLGQLFTTYILIETETGLVLIDQHAAHERIIYEQMKKQFNHIPTIKLLFPHVITIGAHDCQILEPFLDIFNSFGVIIEKISDTQLVIQETPLYLKNQKLDELIKQAISIVHEKQNLEIADLKQLFQEKIHAHLSCISAIRAGTILSPESMREIITDLYKTENKLTCPHGRPTIWHITQLEIEKKFKRDYKS